MYERKLKAYETVEYWDQEIINVLQVKFPTGLTDLEIEEGMLPLDLIGRLAFKRIEGKVISSIVATKACLDLVKDVTNGLYVPFSFQITMIEPRGLTPSVLTSRWRLEIHSPSWSPPPQ